MARAFLVHPTPARQRPEANYLLAQAVDGAHFFLFYQVPLGGVPENHACLAPDGARPRLASRRLSPLLNRPSEKKEKKEKGEKNRKYLAPLATLSFRYCRYSCVYQWSARTCAVPGVVLRDLFHKYFIQSGQKLVVCMFFLPRVVHVFLLVKVFLKAHFYLVMPISIMAACEYKTRKFFFAMLFPRFYSRRYVNT